MPGLLSDLLAWVVIGTFLGGAVLERLSQRTTDGGLLSRIVTMRLARKVAASAWALFAVFWLQLVPHFAFVHKSFVEGILSLAAVPACLYAGLLIYRGRDSLFVLSRAVAVMGVIYLPFETIPAFTVAGVSVPAPRQVLITVVAAQTGTVMAALGYHPELVQGSATGYMSAYRFTTPDGHALIFETVLACTGLGSIAIFAGLIAAVRAPLGRKLRALAVAVPVIWVLNIARTSFIGVVFGKQYLQVFVDEVLFLFGSSDPYMVSFFLSDRVISQLLAVVALVGVTYLVVRELPELLTVIEDVLYMLTNEEYDLREALDLPREPAGRPESPQ